MRPRRRRASSGRIRMSKKYTKAKMRYSSRTWFENTSITTKWIIRNPCTFPKYRSSKLKTWTYRRPRPTCSSALGSTAIIMRSIRMSAYSSKWPSKCNNNSKPSIICKFKLKGCKRSSSHPIYKRVLLRPMERPVSSKIPTPAPPNSKRLAARDQLDLTSTTWTRRYLTRWRTWWTLRELLGRRATH